jgi:hypothetical protein
MVTHAIAIISEDPDEFFSIDSDAAVTGEK